MEKFFDPKSDKKDKETNSINNLTKTIILGAALTSGGVAAAQPTFEKQDQSKVVVHQESTTEHALNQKIIENVSTIESYMQHIAKKVVTSTEPTYAMISESDALGQASFTPNKIEGFIKRRAEITLANNENKKYKLFSRNNEVLSGLLSEKNISKKYGVNEKNEVLDVYTPINFYITITAHKESDTKVVAQIRIINMQTKVTTMVNVESSFEDTGSGSDYAGIQKAVDDVLLQTVTK